MRMNACRSPCICSHTEEQVLTRALMKSSSKVSSYAVLVKGPFSVPEPWLVYSNIFALKTCLENNILNFILFLRSHGCLSPLWLLKPKNMNLSDCSRLRCTSCPYRPGASYIHSCYVLPMLQIPVGLLYPFMLHSPHTLDLCQTFISIYATFSSCSRSLLDSYIHSCYFLPVLQISASHAT